MISKMFARSINNFYWPLLIKESKHSVRCKQIFLSTTIHTTYRKERQWCSISIHAAMYQLWAENKVAASPNILFYLAGVHACCHFTFYPGCFVEIIQLIFIEPKNEQKKINFTTMVPQVELFSFVFWENWRHQKDISKLTDL